MAQVKIYWQNLIEISKGAFLYSNSPKFMQDSIKINSLIEEEIKATEKELGKEKTQELINQFSYEAFRQKQANYVYIINKLQSARQQPSSVPKPNQIQATPPPEEQVKALGFEIVDSYPHDVYRTNRYRCNCLEVEFTYEAEKLLTCDLSIKGFGHMPVSMAQIKTITAAIGHWKP